MRRVPVVEGRLYVAVRLLLLPSRIIASLSSTTSALKSDYKTHNASVPHITNQAQQNFAEIHFIFLA
jgi:hypothetical protein